jgi:radical SAM superfamily enzyme YgiQ (UPF0313 family)
VRVLLVQSYLQGDPLPPVYPLGLAYLATFLRGHEVRIFDPNVAEHPLDDLVGAARHFSPEVAGISLRNIDNQSRLAPLDYYSDFRDVLGAVRASLPGVPIVVGGTGFSMFPAKIMDENPAIDFGVQLEAEEAFPELLANLAAPERVSGVYYRREGQVRFAGPRPLPSFEGFPSPRRDLAEMCRYTGAAAVGIQTKRGCPQNCSYCNYPSLNGNRIRTRSAGEVVDEIEALADSGVRQFMFADSVFNRPGRHAEEICEEIVRRRLNIGWTAYLDVAGCTRESLHLMRQAGCNGMFFSPDGLSQASLDSLRKGLREKEVWNLLRTVASEPALKDVEFLVMMFIDTPGETPFGMLKMLWFKVFALMIKVLRRRRINVAIGWIRIEPDTELHRLAVRQGLLHPEASLLQGSRDELKSFFYLNPALRSADRALLALLRRRHAGNPPGAGPGHRDKEER